jgi:hypothetical protein
MSKRRLFAVPLLVLTVVSWCTTEAADAPAAEAAALPTDGLLAWLHASDAVVQDGVVRQITDHSGRNNHALRLTDPTLPAGNPQIVKHEQAGRAVLRFDGRTSGFAFATPITTARTVFLVVAKHPYAFKRFQERFVIGGKEKRETDFHVGYHWTDTIIELGMQPGCQAWFNGFAMDPSLSEFAPRLAVITLAPAKNGTIAQIARDRDFTDRSWYGDIAEILVYDKTLSDAERTTVERHLLTTWSITPVPPVVVPRETVLPGHTSDPRLKSADAPRPTPTPKP